MQKPENHKKTSKNNTKPSKKLDQDHLMMKAITQIVSTLIQSYDRGKQINISKLRKDVAGSFKLSKVPKLVEIIAGLPDSHR